MITRKKSIILMMTMLVVASVYSTPVKSSLSAYGTNYSDWKSTPYVPASEYIQEGLIVMWDGIENAGPLSHDPSASVWKNLVADNSQWDLTITAANVEWGKNYLRLINKAPAAICSTVIIPRGTKYGTVELVMLTERINNVDSVLALGYDWAGNQIGFGQDSTAFSHRYYQAGWEPLLDTIICYQYLSDNRFFYATPRYMNGIDVSSISLKSKAEINARFGYGFGTIAMGRNPGYKKVYACRVYDRNLTAEELQHNYEIDKVRFGL